MRDVGALRIGHIATCREAFYNFEQKQKVLSDLRDLRLRVLHLVTSLKRCSDMS